MCKIRIKNFGPIKGGYGLDDGWMDIAKVTLFCGPQGSGKSSATKLISLLSWLEKSVYRNPELRIDRDVFVQALEWQNISSYVNSDTEIEYRGNLLRFSYMKGAVSAECAYDERTPYVVPKISYMPAERNFASIVSNANQVAGLPRPLVDMLVEFDHAKKFYASGFRLPANGFMFTFDKDPWIVNGDGPNANKTRLEEASSGLQSMVPMLLVSEYLASHLAKDVDARSMGLFYDSGTAEKQERINTYKRELMSRENLTADQKQGRLELFFAPGRRFLNIVEEPEQNLYPETQRDVVNALVAIANSKAENGLIMSTHSPYVVNQLVTASLAASLRSSASLGELFPAASAVPQSEMRLFELDGDGRIRQLDAPNGVFDDRNVLNGALREWNELFDRLLSLKAREMRRGARQDA